MQFISDKTKLSKPCKPCRSVPDGMSIGNRLLEVLSQTNDGVGLAANQIGYNRRIFVMDVSNERDKPQVFINPVIKTKNNIKMGDIEGCLSCPGHEVKVSRSISVNLEWICRHGKKQFKTFYHLPCRVVLHEMDHLNGKLILDYAKSPAL